MEETKPIRIKEDTKEILNSMKIYKRETYDDILKRLIKDNLEQTKGVENGN